MILRTDQVAHGAVAVVAVTAAAREATEGKDGPGMSTRDGVQQGGLYVK